MADKKHARWTTADKTIKGHQTKDATDQAVPADTATPAELAPVAAVEAASAPTAETTLTDTPVPAQAETIEPDSTPPNQPAQMKKLSAVDVAARVREETGHRSRPPTCF